MDVESIIVPEKLTVQRPASLSEQSQSASAMCEGYA